MEDIIITSGAQSRNYRGLVLSRISVRQRNGAFASTNVIGLCTEFSAKDEVKAFCQERGGNWDGIERMWFVPLAGSSTKEILESFLAIAQEAIAAFGQSMSMGGIHISIELKAESGKIQQIKSWLEKRIRMAAIGLGIVAEAAPIAVIPTVGKVERQEDENDNGLVQCVRFVGKACGSTEFLYLAPPEDQGIYPVRSGIDSDEQVWYWLDGEFACSDSFGGGGGGWH
jgi:hypothetical protein